LSFSTFKLAFSRRRRPIALGVAVLVVVAITTGTMAATGLVSRAPTNVVLVPKDGQKEVGLNQPLKLVFSRPVAVERVEAAFRIEPALDGAMTTSGTDHRHFSWAPTGPWTDLTAYRVTMLSFKDGDGVAIAKRSWHFTTTIVPRVTSLTTDNGATAGDGSELPLSSNLKLAFNTAMAASTIKLLLNGTAADLSWSEDAKVAAFSTKGIAAGGLDLGAPHGLTVDPASHPTITFSSRKAIYLALGAPGNVTLAIDGRQVSLPNVASPHRVRLTASGAHPA